MGIKNMARFVRNLKVRTESFDCCGSASVSHWYGDGPNLEILNDKEGIDKLMVVEGVLMRDRRNLALAVITADQAQEWSKYLAMRGWQKVGPSVVNRKTNNQLETWMLDMVNRKIEKTPEPLAPPVNGFNGAGVRLDRRDEPRSYGVGPRSTVVEGTNSLVKEYFMDANNHRVNFVDLPVFNRGPLRDHELNFYSIRLNDGGGSYSWLQGGTHRFVTPLVVPNDVEVIDEEDEDI